MMEVLGIQTAALKTVSAPITAGTVLLVLFQLVQFAQLSVGMEFQLDQSNVMTTTQRAQMDALQPVFQKKDGNANFKTAILYVETERNLKMKIATMETKMTKQAAKAIAQDQFPAGFAQEEVFPYPLFVPQSAETGTEHMMKIAMTTIL